MIGYVTVKVEEEHVCGRVLCAENCDIIMMRAV